MTKIIEDWEELIDEEGNVIDRDEEVTEDEVKVPGGGKRQLLPIELL